MGEEEDENKQKKQTETGSCRHVRKLTDIFHFLVSNFHMQMEIYFSVAASAVVLFIFVVGALALSRQALAAPVLSLYCLLNEKRMSWCTRAFASHCWLQLIIINIILSIWFIAFGRTQWVVRMDAKYSSIFHAQADEWRVMPCNSAFDAVGDVRFAIRFLLTFHTKEICFWSLSNLRCHTYLGKFIWIR